MTEDSIHEKKQKKTQKKTSNSEYGTQLISNNSLTISRSSTSWLKRIPIHMYVAYHLWRKRGRSTETLPAHSQWQRRNVLRPSWSSCPERWRKRSVTTPPFVCRWRGTNLVALWRCWCVLVDPGIGTCLEVGTRWHRLSGFCPDSVLEAVAQWSVVFVVQNLWG